MFRYLLCCFLLLATGCSSLSKYIVPDKVAIHSGYGWGELTGPDMQYVPTAIRFEATTNNLLRLDRKYGKLNLGVEAFGLAIVEPELNQIVGITPLLRYSYPIHPRFDIYLEGGAGPIYLGLDTYEQEKSGFSFYDQVGAGVGIHIQPKMSLILGYRFSHISHGRVLQTRNRGIEGNTVIFGFSFSFP